MKLKGINDSANKVVEFALATGWACEKLKNGQLLLTKEGRKPIRVHISPSDARGHLNNISRIKRHDREGQDA